MWKKTALILANIGAINWGLSQLDWNIIERIFGSWNSGIVVTVYYLIALCGFYGMYVLFKK